MRSRGVPSAGASDASSVRGPEERGRLERVGCGEKSQGCNEVKGFFHKHLTEYNKANSSKLESFCGSEARAIVPGETIRLPGLRQGFANYRKYGFSFELNFGKNRRFVKRFLGFFGGRAQRQRQSAEAEAEAEAEEETEGLPHRDSRSYPHYSADDSGDEGEANPGAESAVFIDQ